MALLEDSKCFKCHSVDKKKDGPAYKEVAAKYKGKAEAEAKLTKHVTQPSKVKIDGVEEDHGAVKIRSEARINNNAHSETVRLTEPPQFVTFSPRSRSERGTRDFTEPAR